MPPCRILCATRSLRFEYAFMIVCSLICSSVASGRGLDTREEMVVASVSRMILGGWGGMSEGAHLASAPTQHSPIVDSLVDGQADQIQVLQHGSLLHLPRV